MRASSIRASIQEARSVRDALEAGSEARGADHVTVSGVLAEQLAKELGRGAEQGAIVVLEPSQLPRAGVAVHVVAGQPSQVDIAFVDAADRAGVPVVLVQLWPQADWTAPFVLSPFVVECRQGEGFPTDEIGARIVEAVGGGAGLARRIPALRAPSTRRAVRAAVARAALLGARAGRRDGSRAAITLEQARMLSRLEGSSAAAGLVDDERRALGAVVGLLAAGLGLRGAARAGRRILPRPVVDPIVAAIGTWMLAEAYARLEERLERHPPS